MRTSNFCLVCAGRDSRLHGSLCTVRIKATYLAYPTFSTGTGPLFSVQLGPIQHNRNTDLSSQDILPSSQTFAVWDYAFLRSVVSPVVQSSWLPFLSCAKCLCFIRMKPYCKMVLKVSMGTDDANHCSLGTLHFLQLQSTPDYLCMHGP